MKPGGAGIHVVREWTGIVAEHYYTLAERAIRAADPDALFFGDRLPIYYDPAAVRAMAPHVDAIADQLQRRQRRRLDRRLFLRRAEKIVGRQAGARFRVVFCGPREPHGKPQQRPSDDGRDPRPSALPAPPQQPRISRRSRSSSAPIGSMYYDHPKGGRPDGEDYDFGLVDINDQSLSAADIGARRGKPARSSDPCIRGRPAAASRDVRAAPRGDLGRRPLAFRLAEAGEPAAAADRLAGCGRIRRGLPIVERARSRSGDDRSGLFRTRPLGL